MELTDKIRQYIEDRCTTKLEPLEKQLTKAEKDKSADEFAEYRLEWQQRKQVLLNEFKPEQWITNVAAKAWQINIVTHALKYTHSDAKGTSVLIGTHLQKGTCGQTAYLATGNSGHLVLDADGNAAALDVADFLFVSDGKSSLSDYIKRKDSTPFIGLASPDVIEEWMIAFGKVFESESVSSHTLAKQVYFPIGESQYHLLAPLTASSLIQAAYQRINSPEARSARAAKKDGLFCLQSARYFPDLAIKTFGGSQPQNVSFLNKKVIRGGKYYLLNTQPPVWKSLDKPPKSVEAFWSGYLWRIRKQLYELKGFLEWADAQKLNNRHIRDKRAAMVAVMVDEFHQYSARIQLMEPGWSVEAFGTKPEACWLDPGRSDEDFIYEREGKGWCKPLALTYGRVLAKAMNTKRLSMADNETAHFKQQIQREAYRLMIDLEELV